MDQIQEAVARPAVQARPGRAVLRDRRAGRRGRAGGCRSGLDLRAARRGAARDGGHAGARLPHAAAAAAARAGARGRRAHVRSRLAGGRQPDDGVDRRAARADRPGRRLLHPVPGPLRGGRVHRRGSARAGRQRRRGGLRGRTDDRDRRPVHGRRLPGAAALAGPDGARLRRPARHRHLRGAGLRADGGLRRPDPFSQSAARRAAGPAAGACPRGRVVGQDRDERPGYPPRAGRAQALGLGPPRRGPGPAAAAARA